MNRLNILFFSLLGALAAASSACGGVAGDSLFGGSGAGGSGGAPATTSQSATTAVSSSSGTTTVSSSATTSTSTTSVSSTSTATSSSSSTSTSTSSSSSSTSTSSSSGTTLPPVNCNDGTCGTGEICCFDATAKTPPDHCGQPGSCGQGFIELSCSGPEGCPGEICCAHGTVVGQGPAQMFVYAGISCAATCASTATEEEFAICSLQSPGVCGNGQQCVQSQVLGDNYYVCE